MRFKCPPGTAGFSLVEVTMAIGLVSFGLLSLVGMLPTGLQTLRESSEQTVHAQILASVSEGLAVSEFPGLAGVEYYFDENGQLVSLEKNARYRAQLLSAAPSMPGVDPVTMASSLKRIQVGIVRMDIPNAPASNYALQIASQ